jgi:hypothetical protein
MSCHMTVFESLCVMKRRQPHHAEQVPMLHCLILKYTPVQIHWPECTGAEATYQGSCPIFQPLWTAACRSFLNAMALRKTVPFVNRFYTQGALVMTHKIIRRFVAHVYGQWTPTLWYNTRQVIITSLILWCTQISLE